MLLIKGTAELTEISPRKFTPHFGSALFSNVWIFQPKNELKLSRKVLDLAARFSNRESLWIRDTALHH
jgi:hypothetical protein